MINNIVAMFISDIFIEGSLDRWTKHCFPQGPSTGLDFDQVAILRWKCAISAGVIFLTGVYIVLQNLWKTLLVYMYAYNTFTMQVGF